MAYKLFAFPFNLCLVFFLSFPLLMANLKILQWNSRNLHTNLDQFKEFFDNNQCNIICLQSVNRKASELPVLNGFYYPPFYKVNENKNVAVATYVRSDIVVKCVKSPSIDSLSVAIELTLNNRPFTIINCYYPEGVTCKSKTEWILNFDKNNEQVLILGDFNAHHDLWTNKKVNPTRGGQYLSNHIIESSLVLLNDGSYTRIPERPNDSCTAIDLSLISASLAHQCQWSIQDDSLGSDHLPIIIDIFTDDLEYIEKDLENGFNTDKADWTLFKSILQEKLNNQPISQNLNLQERYHKFRMYVIQAAEISIPKKSIIYKLRYGNEWWTDECAIAVTEKKKAYHYYKRHENNDTLEIYKIAKLKCKIVIAKAKIKYLEHYLENNILSHKDANKLWKKIKKIKNKFNLPEKPIIHDNLKTKSNLEKANILAETFAKNSQTEFLPEKIKIFRETEESSFKDMYVPLESNSTNNIPFSKIELLMTLKQIKNTKKATGSDLISYEMIKHFPTQAIEILLDIYNQCYKTGTIPRQWNEAQVKALPKKGKNSSDPNNYRPISLTPHLSKVYERLIKNRLEYHLSKNKVIPNNQAGFKKGRGCTDHIVKLSSCIKKSMSKGKPVLAVFFDVRKAFDSVWIKKVLGKLQKVGIDGSMFHAIKCLITNRSIQVKIKSSVSDKFHLDMGVPQGSVLSPIIFNLMLSDINTISLKSCEMTLYADDLTIWMTPQRYKNLFKTNVCKIVRKKLQENVDKILDYMYNTGFQLSAEKTTLVVFSGRHKIDKTNVFITMNGKKIECSSKAKYLGVTFDDHMNWKCHVDELIRKTDMVWGILKSLRSTPGGNYIPNLLKVIKSIVRSKLVYGQEAYFSAKKDVLKKLQIKECQFLRYALGLAPGTPHELIYKEAGWLPLDRERELRCAQYYFRSKIIENSTSVELDSEYDNVFFNTQNQPPTNNRNSVQHCKPFHYYVSNAITENKLDKVHISKLHISPTPPWLLNQCNIDYEYSCPYTKTNDQLYIATLAKEYIHNHFDNHLKVFTDGSKLNSDQVGCAFFIPDFNVRRQYRLNNNISIFSAEFFAIYMALSFLNDLPRPLTQVVILTDSKSVLESLNNSSSKNRYDLQLECKILIDQIIKKGTDLTLLWIPSHVGITGNDIVDKEAKSAAQKNDIDYDIGLSLSEIYAKLKNKINSDWNIFFHEKCTERNWVKFENYDMPNIAHNLQPLFHRLHACHYQNHYRKLFCVCKEHLSFKHIFDCPQLIPKFDELNKILNEFNIPPTPQNLLSNNNHNGWKLCEIFLRHILNTDIGPYI